MLHQGLFEPQVAIIEEMGVISKRFEELDVCCKVTLKSKLREIAYPDQNSVSYSKKGQQQRCKEEIDDQTPKINKA